MDAEAVSLGVDYLLASQRIDGGWGYAPQARHSMVEPTAWAICALADHPAGGAAALRGSEYLVGAQNNDGGWSNLPGLASDSISGRAVLALSSVGLVDAATRGGDWIRDSEVPGGGWGWCSGTVGFIEPAAFSILAMDAVGCVHDAARLESYVLGLRCPDGGWCSHVPSKVGFAQPSQLSVTPLGIACLATLNKRSEAIDSALRLLAVRILAEGINSAYTTGISLWSIAKVLDQRVSIPGVAAPLTTTLLENAFTMLRNPSSIQNGSVWLSALLVNGVRKLGPRWKT